MYIIIQTLNSGNMINRKVFKNFDEWLNYRKSSYFIGGHDIASILGYDEYKTPLDWFNKYKNGQAMENAINYNTERGQAMENAIASLFESESTEKIIKESGKFFVLSNDNYPEYIIASPDRELFKFRRKNRIVVEIKDTLRTVDLNNPDTFPNSWYIQLTWNMGIGEYDAGMLVVYDGQKQLKWRMFDFDKELFEHLLKGAKEFTENNILKDIPPSPVNKEDILNITNTSEKISLNVAPEYMELIKDYNEVKNKIKTLEKEKEDLENKIALLFDNCNEIVCEGVSVATIKDYTRNTVDTEKLKSEFPIIYEAVKKESKGKYLKILKSVSYTHLTLPTIA